VTGQVDSLSDQQRTCVYRVVQEALTNCVRHARASHVGIEVQTVDASLGLRVTDNGVGVAPDARREGFGLRGIEERVRELGGSVTMRSATGQGSTLIVVLPLETTEAALARAAG
jgi:signal transduction histidine kinase